MTELGVEIEKTNLQFSPEDPLLAEVKDKLTARPEKRKEVEELFAETLTAKRDKIIAVRSGDVLTHIDHLVDGGIPTEYTQNPDESIMSKTEGWYYLTPIYNHPYFTEEHPELQGEQVIEDFYEAVDQNLRHYPEDIAFATALMRNVSPVLIPDWRAKARQLIASYDKFAAEPDYPEALVFEEFSDLLRKQTEKALRDGLTPTDVLSKLRKRRYDAFHTLKELLTEGIDERKVAQFLFDVYKERGGIIVGFNENVVQGEVLTDVSPEAISRGAIHSSPEMAVRPKSGVIDLSSNPISAIEPLGEYEDRVLTELLE